LPAAWSQTLILHIPDEQRAASAHLLAGSAARKDGPGGIEAGWRRGEREPGLVRPIGPVSEQAHALDNGRLSIAAVRKPPSEVVDMGACEVQPAPHGLPPLS
jgi:hypothetical protein